MRRVLFSLVALFASAASLAHTANLVAVDVIDREGGGVLPTYHADGDTWIPGVPGQRYAVRLTNRSGRRVLAVLSVDGVNAVSGETASPQQTGYVLEPYQSTQIAGWRKDLSQVAAFEFTALSNSYAARTGRPNDVGVIGVAVFREKPQPHERGIGIARERRRSADSAGAAVPQRAEAPAADAASPAAKGYAKSMPHAPLQESLGTGHGAREYSSARQVQFERAGAAPDEVVSLRYDSLRNLVAMGVVAPSPVLPPKPRAFPAGFVPDP